MMLELIAAIPQRNKPGLNGPPVFYKSVLD